MDFLSPVGIPQRRGLPGFLRSGVGFSPSTGRASGPNLPRLETGYFEEGTTNLLQGRTTFANTGNSSTGWAGWNGATVTITQGQADPLGGSMATRIQTVGGAVTAKYLAGVRSYQVGESFAHRVWVRKASAGAPNVVVTSNVTGASVMSVVVSSTDWTQVTLYGTAAGTGALQMQFLAQAVGDSLDFYAWHPQIEAGRVWPSPYTDTTRPHLYNRGALLIEEGTIPLLNSPFFASDSNGDGLADGWTGAFALTGAAWRRVTDSRAVHSGIAQEGYITNPAYTDAYLGIYQMGLSGMAGKTVTWRVTGITNKGIIKLQAYDATGATVITGQNVTVTPNVPFDKYITFTVPIGCLNFYVYAMCSKESAWQVNDYIRIFEGGLEEKSYPTSMTQVSRAAETYTIPTAGILSPTQGTVEMWVYVDVVTRRQVANYFPGLFWVYQGVGGIGGIYLIHSANTATWQLNTRDDANTHTPSSTVPDSLTPDGWHHFAVRWSATEAVLFIDGAKQATIINPKLPTSFGSALYIGSANGNYWLNSRFSDIRISNIARSDAQIAALYASGTPAPVDQYTTWKSNFLGGGRRIAI